MGYGYACARSMFGYVGAGSLPSGDLIGFACARPRQGFCYRYPFRCSRLKVEAFRADRTRRRMSQEPVSAPLQP